MTKKTTKPTRRARPSLPTRQHSLLLPISGGEAADNRAPAPSIDAKPPPTVTSSIPESPSHVQGTHLVSPMRFDSSMTQWMARPLEVWLRWQTDMLAAAESVAIGWFERRREAVEATLETIEKLAHCGDLNEAASIQHKWFDEAVKRVTSDIEALTGHAMALSQEAVAATRHATQTLSEAHTAPKHRSVEKGPRIDTAA